MTILVTRRLPATILSKLEGVGTVDLQTASETLAPDELRHRLRTADALLCMLTDVIDRAAIDAGPALKVIANVAVGYNNIDVEYARTRGIVVTNTPDVLTDAVADFTWALILALTRRVSEGERLVRRGEWTGWAFDQMLGSSLAGKQLGIVGLGRIGRAVAQRAGAFSMRLAYSPRNSREAGTNVADAAESMSVDRLLNTSDIVSLHVPLTDETRHLIDRRSLARMKRTAYLINTSRGPIVDEAALAWALEHHLLAGAALDVYEREPTVHRDLLRLENVLLTPHLGSATVEARTAMANLAAENVIAVLAGQPALTPV